MRKMKKTLSFLTAAALMVSTLSGSYVSVNAATTTGTVYLEEDFEDYSTGTVIASGTSTVEDVTKGSITYSAGVRGNGSINCSASIAAEDDNQYLYISEDGYATASRGVSFVFDVDLPSVSEITEGYVLELSMDMTSNAIITLTDFGDLPAVSSSVEDGALVHVRAIIDPAQDMQYIIATDTDDEVILSEAAELTATGFTGATFYTASTVASIDNLVIEQKPADTGIVTVSVTDGNGDALAETTVTIGSLSAETDENGQAVFALPDGSYTVTASKSGYEYTTGMGDNAAAEITVAADAQNVPLTLSVMSYVKVPDTVEITGGQSFIAAPKSGEEAVTTAAFTSYVLDQYGIEMTTGEGTESESEYGTTWSIFPSGTEDADESVTIDENGVVTVASSYNSDNKITAYDVTLVAATDDRNQKVTKTLYIGTSDVSYYEALDWEQEGGSNNRGGSVSLGSAVSLPDVSSVTVNVSFPTGTDGQTTLVLTNDGGEIFGLQLQSDNTVYAWTGWTGSSASVGYNQSGDLGAFDNSGVLVTDYDQSVIAVTFVIDQTNQSITASCGSETVSLPFSITGSELSLTGFQFGQYRNYGAVTVEDILVSEPDSDYLAILGDADFAKISGQTVTRTFSLGQSVIVADETFTWTVTGDDTTGVTIEDGVLSVADTAAAGDYTITATSTSNEAKTAQLVVAIGDFQKIDASNILVSGPRAYAYGTDAAGSYAITGATDAYGDDVAELLPAAVWTTSNSEVLDITETGEASVKGAGTAVLTATITNGTAVSTVTVDVTVAVYYITAAATGDTTAVDTSDLISDSNITGYQVTTSKDGTLVSQQVVTELPTEVDTTGADAVEIAPVFTYAIGAPGTLGDAGAGYDIIIPADTYDFNVKNTSGQRCDVYVNDQMLVNNILQGGSTVNNLDVNDIVVSEGIATITTADYSSGVSASAMDITVSVVKSPSVVDRTKKAYVLGDSLVCIYYNGGDADNNYQTGWGQVLGSYMAEDAEVVDLGNSGVTASGLLGTAFTQVLASGMAGDVLVLESGYNDKTYTTQEVMTNAVTSMVEQAKAIGMDVVLVSPNASVHDYKADVAWTSVMAAVAEDTDTDYIDLAALSYAFLYENYGTDTDPIKATYNVSDTLHSTYHGANKWASIVATELYALGYMDIVNTEYSYSFVDYNGNTIVCQAEGTETTTPDEGTETTTPDEGTETSGSETTTDTETTSGSETTTDTETTSGSETTTNTETTTNSEASTGSETEESATPEVGDTFKKGKVTYKVTKKDAEVEYVSTSATKKVTIPTTVTLDGTKYKVTSIASGAFKNNKKVTQVVIGNNVTTIGANAFSGCTKLKAVTIGTKAKTIGKKAFYGCSALKTITIKSTKLTSVKSNAFKGIYAKAKIKVPAKKLSAYKKLLKGKGQGSKVKITKL